MHLKVCKKRRVQKRKNCTLKGAKSFVQVRVQDCTLKRAKCSLKVQNASSGAKLNPQRCSFCCTLGVQKVCRVYLSTNYGLLYTKGCTNKCNSPLSNEDENRSLEDRIIYAKMLKYARRDQKRRLENKIGSSFARPVLLATQQAQTIESRQKALNSYQHKK